MERPKSASYLRLENSKWTSMCQVFASNVPGKPKRYTKFAQPVAFCTIYLVAKYQRLEAGPFEDVQNVSNKSHNAEKRKRPFVTKHQKIEGVSYL